MGMIAIIKSWLPGNRRANLELWGTETGTADNFTAPGDDSQPLPGEPVIIIPMGDRGARAILATVDPQNEPKAAPGEKRIYARKTDGTLAVDVWLKRTGEIVIANSVGQFKMSSSGTVTINGLTIDASGNLNTTGTVSAGAVGAKVGLTTHGHSALNSPPTPNT